jgi:hypothetical protein
MRQSVHAFLHPLEIEPMGAALDVIEQAYEPFGLIKVSLELKRQA